MDITPLLPTGRQVIEGYGDGGFRISGEQYRGAVLVLPEQTITWSIREIASLGLDHLAVLASHEPGIELLLLGCGTRICPIDADLRAGVRNWGVVIEEMDTGAACRTYNVLLMEGRRVAAALLPID